MVLRWPPWRPASVAAVLPFVTRPEFLRRSDKRLLRTPWFADHGGCEIPSWVRGSDASAGWRSRYAHESLPLIRRFGLIVLWQFLCSGRFSFPQPTRSGDVHAESARIQRRTAGVGVGHWLHRFQICPATY